MRESEGRKQSLQDKAVLRRNTRSFLKECQRSTDVLTQESNGGFKAGSANVSKPGSTGV